MRAILLYQYIVFIFLITIAYYILGGHNFPDYEAYQRIAYDSFGNDIYFTEYISRFILYEGVFENFDRVDQLAVFVQCLFIIGTISVIIKNNNGLYLVVIFVAFYGPLLMTTVLRASPLYLLFFFMSFFYLKERRVELKDIIIISVFGSLFHDSFILISVVVFIVWLVQNKKKPFNNTFMGGVLIGSFLIIFVMILFMPLITSMLKNSVLGARAVYINAQGFSFIKISIILLLNSLTLKFLLFEKSQYHQRLMLLTLVSITNIIFAFGSTAGIRFSTFAFSYLFVVRDCFLFRFESASVSNQAIASFFLYPLLFARCYLLL